MDELNRHGPNGQAASAQPPNLGALTDDELEERMENLEPEHMDSLEWRTLMRERKRREAAREPIPDGVVPLYAFEKPDPLKWLVAGLVPKDHLTMLIGDGGTGKSFLALHMAICVATGNPFLRRGVRRGCVLYVDHELDEDEQKRRTARVAEGMGLDIYDRVLQRQFYYLRPSSALGTKTHHNRIMRVVNHLDIDMIVLDSLTMGAAAADVKDEADVVPIVQQIRDWPTTVAIDHVSHGTAKNQRAAEARAYGSVFKRNAARSSLTLASGDSGGYVLQQEKSNFNAGQARLCYASDFNDKAVTFERIDEADERVGDLLGEMSSADVTLTAVKDMYGAGGGPVLPNDVVEWREKQDECKTIAKGTVENHFVTLRKRDEVVSTGDGKAVRPAGAN